MGFPIMQAVRRDGRVVECTGLENRHGFIAHLGFKSLSLHHLFNKCVVLIIYHSFKINISTLLLIFIIVFGEMAEWSNAPVLKTGMGL